MGKGKQALSLKQQYQRLTQAKANAIRAGQSTPKLDAKIERIKVLMESTIQRPSTAKSGTSKYMNYKGLSKMPMCGGSCSSK